MSSIETGNSSRDKTKNSLGIWSRIVDGLRIMLMMIYNTNRPILDGMTVILFFILLGDYLNFYWLPYVVIIPMIVIFVVLLLIQMFVYLPVWVNSVILLLTGLYLGVFQILVSYIIPQGLQSCPNVNQTAIEEKALQKDYVITRVIQGVESASGNAIMLAKQRKDGRGVVLKYYADPNAEESIGFACSLDGDVARVFPSTLRAGRVVTSRGEVLFTVQTLAEGEEIDSWVISGPSKRTRRAAAGQLLKRTREFTNQQFCHRDLHPGNIFVTSTGRVSFIDVDLGFVESWTKDKFFSRCQRFFYEMPLRLVKFVRTNLTGDEQTVFLAWWLYMNTEKYGLFSVDQLFMATVAFVLSKRYGVLSTLSKATANDEKTWKKAESYAKEPTNTVLPAQVIPVDSEVTVNMLRFMMGGFQTHNISQNITIDSETQTKLGELYNNYLETQTLPRVKIDGTIQAEFDTVIQVNKRLSVNLNIPVNTQIAVRKLDDGVTELSFGNPVTLSTSGLTLAITYARIDKSSEIDSKYYVEGTGTTLGGATFNIQDVVGEVVTPNGPLPTGNEVMALVTALSFSDLQWKVFLGDMSVINVQVDDKDGGFNFNVDTTDPDNLNVTTVV